MQNSIHHLDLVCFVNVRHSSCVWVSSSGSSRTTELDGLWLGLRVTRCFPHSDLKNQGVQLQESLQIQIHEALPTGKSQIHCERNNDVLMDKQGQKPKHFKNGF